MGKLTAGIRGRMFLAFLLFLVGMLVIIGRLVKLQIIDGEEYKEKAAQQQTKDATVDAVRGTIYDRNMKVLAQSATSENVMISPNAVKTAVEAQKKRAANAAIDGQSFNEVDVLENVVSVLVEKTGADEEALRYSLSLGEKSSSRTVKKKVDQSIIDELIEIDLPGVFFEESTKRYYPYSSFASHVLGFVNDDGHGALGLEMALDDALSGTPGRIQVTQDANGHEMPNEYENYIAPEDGNGVVLTIDEVMQHYVEKYLKEAYQLYDIRNGAAAIMMNPNTGEILAMAVEPNFDLNDPSYIPEEMREILLSADTLNSKGEPLTDAEKLKAYRDKLWRNKAVNDTYEPGSTFKSIVAASALEAGAVNPATDTFFCNGYRIVADRTIHCHNRTGHGSENFFKALENSCNPAFMDIGARLGRDNFRKFFEAFGFRDTTGFIIPGESSGIFFNESNFKEVELATSSFGQGFTVTPLQMVTAVSAVVNGGNLMKPNIVKAYTDLEGNVTKTVEPQIVRQVVSQTTSETMRTALEGVVAHGTGNGAYVAGYRIGGKTGTSEKQPRGQGKYVASFVGFAPADDPQLVCLLLLDEPGGALTGGGAIAAPTVGKILADSLKYLGYEPQYTVANTEEVELDVPSLVGLGVSEATANAEDAGFNVTVKGSGTEIVSQLPKAGSHLKSGGLIILYTQSDETQTKTTVPNFTGMTRSQATNAAKAAGLNITLSGGGEASNVTEDMIAVKQSPSPDIEVIEGSTVTVDFAYNSND